MPTIKLCVVFIMLQYEDFFKQVLQADGNLRTIENVIERNAKLGVWGNRETIIAINILTTRPIYSYSYYPSNSMTTNILPHLPAYPIPIAFNKNHFVGILRTNNTARLAQPSAQTNFFWKFNLGYIDYYNN